MEKGLKVFYRALEHYMTPNTTFAQAREATVNAATDLYGANSAEVQKVEGQLEGGGRELSVLHSNAVQRAL